MCLGFEPGAAGWQAQTKQWSYGGRPNNFAILTTKPYQFLTKWAERLFFLGPFDVDQMEGIIRWNGFYRSIETSSLWWGQKWFFNLSKDERRLSLDHFQTRFFKKNDQPRTLFCLFSVFSIKYIIQFVRQCENVHPISATGIRTYDIFLISLLP